MQTGRSFWLLAFRRAVTVDKLSLVSLGKDMQERAYGELSWWKIVRCRRRDSCGLGSEGKTGWVHVIYLVPVSNLAMAPSLYKTLPYDPTKDFAPVALLAAAPNIMVVQPDFTPCTAYKDLIALAKQKGRHDQIKLGWRWSVEPPNG